VSEEVFEGFELSRQQKRLWLQGAQDLYVARCVVLLEGALDQTILLRALRMTISQHEMLRTSFQQLPGMKFPLQVIAEDVDELSLGHKRGNRFDLKRAPLIRCNLRRLATNRHMLSITQPALCADADALAQLVLNLSRCYEACVRGQEWLEKPVQHVDFSEWQHELSNSPESETGKKYWRERVEAARSEADHKEFAPAAFRFDLNKDLTETVLLTAWQVLISRLTEQAEIVIGHFCNGRRITHLQGCLGPLGEFLPLSLRVDGASRFSELTRQVCEAVDANRKYQEYFSGDLSSLPVQFEFSERPQPQIAGDVRFTVRKVYACTDRYKLKLSVVGRKCELHYDETSYSREAAKRIAAQFKTLLESAIRHPDSIIKNLEVLSEDERRVTVFDWNETAREYRGDVCLHELFEEQVARTPDRPAVIFREQQYNFAELNARADTLAQQLRRQGVGPEVRVALLMERSLEMVVAVLAIWKAGGVYVPLDVTQPPQRLQLILDDAKPKLILNADDTDQIRGFDPRHPCSTNLAYIIYTSGSTGTPKGVMVTHRSAVNLITALQQAIYNKQPTPLRVSLNAPLSFDASVKQLLQLLSGHTLVIIPEEIRANGPELLTYLKRQQVDVFDCTPSQLQLLLPEPEPRLLLVGGESIGAELWEQLAADTSREYYNVYGPTECTVDATAAKVQGETPNIGRPLANTRIYLLDEALQPVPLGVRGEICIAGEGLARGYLHDAVQTALKFVPEPFSGEDGARMYRTGDLGRYLEDGRLEFLGRRDHQVKLRGVRIELGEIEAALKKHEAVRDAVVQIDDETRLVAYVAVERRYLPVIDGRARYQLPNGLAILHQNKNETDYLFQELFENCTYIRHGIELRDNACVVDAGANIGLFTLFVLDHSRDAHVYAFEPIKPIFETLKTNVELYSKNVKLFPFGLSDRTTTASFTFYPHYSMMSGLSDYARPADDVEVVKKYLLNQQDEGTEGASPLWQHADEFLPERFVGQTYQSQLRTLSEVIRSEKLDLIDLLKIDVQRAELDVLNGIEEHDWQKIQQIVMEVHDAKGEASEGRLHEISALLEHRGFKVIAEQDKALRGTDRYNLYARQNGTQIQRVTSQTKKHTIVTPLASASEFRNALKQQLPEYMIPSAFVCLEKLPLTRNGKVDRAALAALDSGRAATAYVAPQNQMEQTVARIWQDALRVERVGANDNFFELGGHSLLVAQVHNRLVSTLGREISMVEMFQYPTVSTLAKRLSEVEPRARSFQSVHERAARQKEAMDRQRRS
jgi:amino acid adenylation domain-containing protein/FkbM family methyltransferase